jgi:hypothetical protein
MPPEFEWESTDRQNEIVNQIVTATWPADEAAHKLVELESGDPDEFRIMELGNLVDWISHMCVHHR